MGDGSFKETWARAKKEFGIRKVRGGGQTVTTNSNGAGLRSTKENGRYAQLIHEAKTWGLGKGRYLTGSERRFSMGQSMLSIWDSQYQIRSPRGEK